MVSAAAVEGWQAHQASSSPTVPTSLATISEKVSNWVSVTDVTVVVAVAPVKTTMELLALVLEAKAQVPEEPVKVQEVDWTIAGVLMANVSNKIEVAALFSHSIPKKIGRAHV